MNLNMIKGKELALFVENAVDSIKDNGFWKDSYTKAFAALNDYIKYADKISEKISKIEVISKKSDILYRSPQNIIAFSGKRGTGKSSVMLSFSDMLSTPNKLQNFCSHYEITKDCSAVKNKSFITLDPIDPTTMEKNQSILSIVLSRLLFKAEESWNQHLNFYGGFQDRESKKTELLSIARKCLTGISTIKSKKEISSDLAELQRVGDSSILKQNLYDFVELFLQFTNMSNNNEAKNRILVVQIDDVDCQISQGYEVMEDIRKYFTIPNVLILMATDTKLLRQLLTQHYVEDFSVNLHYKLIDTEDVRQLGEKLLVKMLPPTRVIHLPYIDETIRDKIDQLHIYYYEKENENEKKGHNLLDFTGSANNEKNVEDRNKEKYDDYNFQSVILRYIYQKTHIVFTSHSAYTNNIIPTTLRGLAHLLGVLSSMEDVPEIDFNTTPFTAEYLAEAIDKQIPVLEKNLNLFEEYFLHDWLPAKLPKDMTGIIENLSGQAPDQRITFIIKELYKFYNEYYITQNKEHEKKNKNDNSISYLFNYAQKISPSYADLDCMLRMIQGTKTTDNKTSFRRFEDFYFIFAIRTLITIKNNKDILKFKLRSIQRTKNNKIIFNYLEYDTSIPQNLYLDKITLCSVHLVKEQNSYFSANDKNKYLKYYIHNNGNIDNQRDYFNFTGGVIRWLNPQENDWKKMRQLDIYKAQELATIVAVNCDVQEQVRKEIIRKTKKHIESQSDNKTKQSDAVKKGLALIQNAVASINENMFQQYNLSDDQELVWKINDDTVRCLNEKNKLLEKKTTTNTNQWRSQKKG